MVRKKESIYCKKPDWLTDEVLEIIDPVKEGYLRCIICQKAKPIDEFTSATAQYCKKCSIILTMKSNDQKRKYKLDADYWKVHKNSSGKKRTPEQNKQKKHSMHCQRKAVKKYLKDNYPNVKSRHFKELLYILGYERLDLCRFSQIELIEYYFLVDKLKKEGT